MKTSKKKPMTDSELLELGKKLQAFYDSGYFNRRQSLLFSFYKGLASGTGAFIGGTLVIALLLWILSLFSEIPLLGHLLRSIQDSLGK